MNILSTFCKTFFIYVFVFLTSFSLQAHNGKIAHARPLGKIMIDGDLADWPATAVKYNISTLLSDPKTINASDFSGFFQVGYRQDNRSLYLAFTITDNDFIEDTSANVQFNTQDCLELCLDARHLPFGSGVASFMYSKKLRNTNKALFDPFAKAAAWDMMEVAMKRKGNVRYYEWRINLGEQFVVGKTVGLDFQLFDKDANGNFAVHGWGKGGSKFRMAKSLGDILLLPANQQLATVSGKVRWDKEMKTPLPGTVILTTVRDRGPWFATELDSTGNFTATVPPGKYAINLPDQYFELEGKAYTAAPKEPVTVQLAAGQKKTVPGIIIAGGPAPDLLPAKGVLHTFDASTPSRVDAFIESYRKVYGIPGVSLALIKDGALVYYKTYGEKNSITGEKLDSNTLFEAASVTKPVFAFAVQRLAERGVIDLNKPLYLYLPYPDIASDERYKLMTAKHVLTHRTGFPNWRDGKLTLLFTPGTDYNYSGEGFEYLKLVVEKITGKKVEQVLKEEVLDPVGLSHTFFSANDSLRKVVSNGHFDRLPTYDDPPAQPGMAYSMHTEARVFTKFMRYMLEQKGLSAQTYDSMFSKHSEFKFDPGDEKPRYPGYMGMSLEIRESPFGKSFGHGGNNGDFLCHFEVYNDLKMGYVIFTNANTSYPLLKVIRQFLVEGKE